MNIAYDSLHQLVVATYLDARNRESAGGAPRGRGRRFALRFSLVPRGAADRRDEPSEQIPGPRRRALLGRGG
jgi:hypothetical protein